MLFFSCLSCIARFAAFGRTRVSSKKRAPLWIMVLPLGAVVCPFLRGIEVDSGTSRLIVVNTVLCLTAFIYDYGVFASENDTTTYRGYALQIVPQNLL